MSSKVTPWTVEGSIDYTKLLKEFGVSSIDSKQIEYVSNLSKKKNLPLHLFLRRKLFYAQRDFEKVIEAHKKGENFFIYTGRSPGGSMHIAHLIPFLFTKYLQDIFDCNVYIQIPDDEKFLFKKGLTLEEVNSKVKSDLADISALGFNPDKTFIFKNSEYIKNVYPLYLKTAKKLLFSQASATFGFNNQSNIGMINYPALQIIPTFFEKNYCLIPCGIDQDPYFRLQRDIANSLGYNKCSTILSKFLSGLTGPEGKMSASDSEKAILLTDDQKTVKKKINKYAFSGGKDTLEEHRKFGGDTSIDVSFNWLYFLFEESDEMIENVKKNYESGKLLSGELKKILIDKINTFIELHNKNKKLAIENNLLNKYMYSGKLASEMWGKEFK